MRKKVISRIFTIFIMIMIVFLTLSTATYAWFSSNNYVNLSGIEFKAASNNDGNSSLFIDWNIKYDNYKISFNNLYSMYPMIPTNKLARNMSYLDFINNFNTSNVDELNIYKRDGSYCTPYTLTKENDTQDYFYILNNAQYNLEISMKYAIDGDLKEQLHIALFINNELKGILSNSNIYYGYIIEGKNSRDTLFDNSLIISNLDKIFIIENYVECRFVAWYDGITTLDQHASKTSLVTNLEFLGDFVD